MTDEKWNVADETPTLPEEVIVGTSWDGVRLAVFGENEWRPATEWVAIDSQRRKLYRVKLEPIAELVYVPPTAADLRQRPL